MKVIGRRARRTVSETTVAGGPVDWIVGRHLNTEKEMDEKTLQALTALAEKLGTTAEYLWGVLLKQAPIAGITDLAVMVAWGIAIAMWARFVQRKTNTPAATESDLYPSAEWSDQFGVGLAWASVFVTGLIVVLIAGASLSTVIAAIFNPEYWALKQILK